MSAMRTAQNHVTLASTCTRGKRASQLTRPYWQGDGVTLYHGDCREVTGWLSADVLVTDPPYGVEWRPGQSFNHAPGRARQGDKLMNDRDTQIRDDALALWGKKRPAVVFGTWRRPRPADVTQRLIWHKQGNCPGMNNAAWYSAEEEIYLIGGGWTGKPAQNVIVTRERRTGATGFVARTGHPTPKPGALMEVLISKCPPGVIADPFCGSGSTLMAARNQGRQAIGVEIDERYCEVAARRLDQGILTGTGDG